MDSQKQQNDSKAKVEERFFVLSTNQRVYHLGNIDNENFHVIKEIDLRHRNLLYEIKLMKNSEWCHAFITERSITFNGTIYSFLSEL